MVPLQWSPWVSFDTASFSALPACPGVYRVRVIGHESLHTSAKRVETSVLGCVTFDATRCLS